jgi:hypothetical protein
MYGWPGVLRHVTGVVTGCVLAFLAKAHKGVALAPLRIPGTFSTTLGRPWLVDIFALPVWVRSEGGRGGVTVARLDRLPQYYHQHSDCLQQQQQQQQQRRKHLVYL